MVARSNRVGGTSQAAPCSAPRARSRIGRRTHRYRSTRETAITSFATPPEPVTPPLLEHLLQRTSRTFALTIPFLAEPLRCEVTVAYLLFRVADTLEDATHLGRERKLEELVRLEGLLERASPEEARALSARWTDARPIDHAGYVELLGELPALIETALRLDAAAWDLVARHTARTTRRMAAFAARSGPEGVTLRDLDDLRAYCYAVAGIVGELLTELFLRAEPALGARADALRRDAAAFGEALQLVNILKDAADDSQEGRHFLPSGVQRDAVFALARRDLDTAARYCGTLEAAGASPGTLGFAALPVLLARATLEHVERHGPGAKIGREAVAALLDRLRSSLAVGGVASLVQGGRQAAQEPLAHPPTDFR